MDVMERLPRMGSLYKMLLIDGFFITYKKIWWTVFLCEKKGLLEIVLDLTCTFICMLFNYVELIYILQI